MPAGRFAPSPTGPLHVGNLRTALVAWLAARADGSAFGLRVDDLDPGARRAHEAGQLADLAAVGVEWDGPIVRQSERREHYAAALAALEGTGRTYECFCTRREVLEAARAPHGEAPEGAYPGTCRDLTAAERARRRAEGRPPALRLRAGGERIAVTDALAGPYEGAVDDLVLRRNDGLPAYNLTVVVDDAAQGVAQVVRGDDLLSSTPRQVLLARLLGLPVPAYLHVPLVVGADGARLAKRDGAVTLADLAAGGVRVEAVRDALVASLGPAVAVGPDGRPDPATFVPDRLPPRPWPWRPPPPNLVRDVSPGD